MTRFVNQYLHKNVKFNARIDIREDGATHQILEDIGLMKMLPGMTVINTWIQPNVRNPATAD
jgi:transketolase C-terminal domain/subunit